MAGKQARNQDLARRDLGLVSLVDGSRTVDKGPGAMMRTTERENEEYMSSLRD